jgi:hypothetical protein
VIKKLLYNDDGDFRPAVAYTVVGVSALLVGYFVYSAWAGMEGQLESNMLCVTPGCGYADNRKLEPGETFPGLCPKCEKKSVYWAWKCPKCGKPNVPNQQLGKPGTTKCSKCGTEIRRGGQ